MMNEIERDNKLMGLVKETWELMERDENGGIRRVALGKPKPTETLRDQFAMAALQGLIAAGQHGASDGSWTYPQLRSKHAYEYADAMLEAREETK